NGGTMQGQKMKLLKQIRLYSKPDYKANGNNATPIKTVHFVYDYSLCPNVPNNSTPGQGKLTLKKVYFTYRDSKKGKLSPYVFTYKNPSTPYHLKAYDRWGNYKRVPLGINGNALNDSLPTFEFPYVDQNKALADTYATTWILSKIELPSGGEIKIETEADDYAFVQHKKAMEMVKIVDVQTDINSASVNSGIIEMTSNKKIFFEMQPGTTIEDYVRDIKDLYFRCLMKFNGGYDYVSGYAKIKSKGKKINTNLGYIELEPVGFDD